MIKHFLVYIAVFIFILQPIKSFANNDIFSKQQEKSKQYNFSTDWFSGYTPQWKQFLQEYKGKKNVRYLEIGVFEGRSAIWMLENILTDDTARLTCIDIFPKDLKKKFLSNLKISGHADKVTTITGSSQIELRHLPLDSFDIIYIDGSHLAHDVLTDAVLSWPLLKDGGMLLFDDYWLEIKKRPIELRPKVAIDAFLTAFRNSLELIYKEGQVFIKKRETPGRAYVSVGQYYYSWYDSKLYHSDTKKQVPISEEERVLIEEIIKSRQFGETQYSVDRTPFQSDDFKKLQERLNFRFEDL